MVDETRGARWCWMGFAVATRSRRKRRVSHCPDDAGQWIGLKFTITSGVGGCSMLLRVGIGIAVITGCVIAGIPASTPSGDLAVIPFLTTPLVGDEMKVLLVLPGKSSLI